MKNKHIMFVDKNKVVNYSGGVEKVICSFANEFVGRGYDVSIVCLDTEFGQPHFELDNRVWFINLCYSYSKMKYNGIAYLLKKAQREVMRLFLGKKLSRWGIHIEDPREHYFYREFASRLRKCIKDIQPDIILPTDVEATTVVIDVLDKLQMSDVKVISMCHSDPSRLEYRENYIQALRKCTAVQVLLPIYKTFFINKGINNVIVIPNGIEQVDDDAIRNLNKCNKKIICVGRVDGAGKRQHLLIEAFAMIADKYPDWSVHFYGDVANKRYKKKLDNLIESYGLSDRIIFEGTTREMQKVLLEADIFAFPTEYEGLSMSLLEAMTAGLPVLAFKECRSISSMVKDDEDGVLSDTGVNAYIVCLERMITDVELRVRLGKTAHENAKKYNPINIWNIWNNYLIKLMKGECQ